MGRNSLARDVTGMRFGMRVVLEHKGRGDYLVKCDCGTLGTARGSALRAGRARSCGCLESPDLTGKVFTRLTVLKRLPAGPDRGVRWQCRCSCGRTCISTTQLLNRGERYGDGMRSCGCLRDERARESLAKRRNAQGRAA